MIRQFLITLILGFVFAVGVTTATAQEAAAGDWCHQPSDVVLEFTVEYSGRNYLQPIGLGVGGVRLMYQEYNRRLVLMRSDTREIVRVIHENIDLSSMDWIDYAPDCQYLAIEATVSGVSDWLMMWDVNTEPATYIGEIDQGLYGSRDRSTSVMWSPDSRYALVTTRHEVILWDVVLNTRLTLSRDIRIDCGHGCSGELFGYNNMRWQLEDGTIWLNLPTQYAVTYALATGQPTQIAHDQGYIVEGLEAQTVATRLASTYHCRPSVEYQTYNRRLVLHDYLDRELVAVIETDLDLAGFQFLGWSPTCRYIAAAIENSDGALMLAFWNVDTHERTMRPIADYVDRAAWSTTSDVIDIRTDAERFTASP